MLILTQAGNTAETTFNGFASFVGGIAIKTVDLPNGSESRFIADPGRSTNELGLENDDAFYGDTVSYLPDTNYGLQVRSDLTQGLTVTAQITGRGSNDLQAELEWAYLSYDLTAKTELQVGRQRMPLYYYSDFIDVGYAYHWIRPPTDVYLNTLPTYEGVTIINNSGIGDWNIATRFYTGTTFNEGSQFGNFGGETIYGLVFNISNDWLQFRASYLTGDFYTSGITDKNNTQRGDFGSFAVNITPGDFFFFAEATDGVVNDSFLASGNFQLDALAGTLASAGYHFGNLTPHLSYSESSVDFSGDLNPVFEPWYFKRQTITAGVRWDFHPAAALKVEYASMQDDSFEQLLAIRGKASEADLVSVGFDIIF